ncbi:NAD(+) diphosphatase [Aquabacterium sp.]|uniref:NAD(+) diphosphatase n=1 Tax=Aquabacterium sp. TaxID=1872578 RepID=UPI003784A3B1
MTFQPAVQPLQPASENAWCFAFVEGQLLLPLQPEGEVPALRPVMPAPLLPEAQSRHYLGRCEALDCWALRLPAVPSGWRAMPLRAAMMAFPPTLMALAGRAAQVLEWDRAHRFCGVCGTPTELVAHERARRCPACGHTAYPRLSPSMMALVWREGELLLARGPHFAKGMYSALAGFVEPGESIEDCVHREVAEEVGVQVTDLRYYGSQSWPFPHSLMIAYTARWVAGDIVPQEGEIEHAAWFPIDALPGVPPRFSISGHLIRDTVEALSAGSLR